MRIYPALFEYKAETRTGKYDNGGLVVRVKWHAFTGSQKPVGGHPPVTNWERELRQYGNRGVKKALWPSDRSDLVGVPFFA